MFLLSFYLFKIWKKMTLAINQFIFDLISLILLYYPNFTFIILYLIDLNHVLNLLLKNMYLFVTISSDYVYFLMNHHYL